jgi:hypothetical protein
VGRPIPFLKVGIVFYNWHTIEKDQKMKRHLRNMRVWLATAGSGDSGKTRPPAAAREEDICHQAKDSPSCYFTDLLKLGGDRKRGGGG